MSASPPDISTEPAYAPPSNPRARRRKLAVEPEKRRARDTRTVPVALDPGVAGQSECHWVRPTAGRQQAYPTDKPAHLPVRGRIRLPHLPRHKEKNTGKNSHSALVNNSGAVTPSVRFAVSGSVRTTRTLSLTIPVPVPTPFAARVARRWRADAVCA